MESKAQDIIAFANQFGPLTHENLTELTKLHPISVRRWLPRLVKERKLYCVKQAINRPNVYATWNINRRTDLAHDLARADCATALHSTGLLTYWNQPRVKQPVGKSVNEDARFELTMEFEDKVGVLHFWFEMDCGSERYSQIEDKFKRYLALKDSAQVLFVVKFNPVIPHRTSPQTLAHLAERYIRKSDWNMHKKFLFADYREFVTNPIGNVCYIPHDPDRQAVLCAIQE